ncbi:MAG TPA: hypothetical protein VK935_03025 [Actinomycetospora sp.]|nr:hypothetical protein [Actinomycetospora sp.]
MTLEVPTGPPLPGLSAVLVPRSAAVVLSLTVVFRSPGFWSPGFWSLGFWAWLLA